MDTTKISFEDIRTEIKNYLSQQDTFKDYNFTAPGISVLVDALAYTSHYLVRYANFSINECFLDSAQLRHNVVSQAKQIGYFPYQWKSAKAKVILRYFPANADEWKVNSNIGAIKLPEGTTFIGENDEGETFLFRTTEQQGFKKEKDGTWAAELEIVEGTFTTDSFVQDEMYISRYYLQNERADLDYLSIRIHENEADMDGVPWRPAKEMVDFGPNATLYYLQETFDEKVEVYFGDGKISKLPAPYSIIKISYLVTNGPAANNIANFKLATTIDTSPAEVIFENGEKIRIPIAQSSFTVSCNPDGYSSGGAERENIESIKLNAPMYWQAQDRAVTIQDYNALLINKFGGWLKSVISWGGETAIPPRYGKVIICGLGKYSEILSPSQKQEILEYLNAKNLPDIDVEIIDPDPVQVDVNIVVDWWKWKTTLTATDIKNKLIEETEKFFEQYLSSFNVKMKYSSLLIALTAVTEAIDNLVVHMTLTKHITPDWRHTTTYEINFLNPIEPGSVLIGPWTVGSTQLSCWDMPKVDASGKTEEHGILYLGKSSKDNSSKEAIGSVNYDTGEVVLSSYKFDNGVVNSIPVSASPNVLNIATAKNGIFRLNSVTIDAEERV